MNLACPGRAARPPRAQGHTAASTIRSIAASVRGVSFVETPIATEIRPSAVAAIRDAYPGNASPPRRHCRSRGQRRWRGRWSSPRRGRRRRRRPARRRAAHGLPGDSVRAPRQCRRARARRRSQAGCETDEDASVRCHERELRTGTALVTGAAPGATGDNPNSAPGTNGTRSRRRGGSSATVTSTTVMTSCCRARSASTAAASRHRLEESAIGSPTKHLDVGPAKQRSLLSRAPTHRPGRRLSALSRASTRHLLRRPAEPSARLPLLRVVDLKQQRGPARPNRSDASVCR